MKLEYSSNNSGGSWWLTDDDWYAMEREGWIIEWFDDRFLDSLAGGAYKIVASKEDATRAILKWEQITGQNAAAQGCSCCGRPHYFYLYDDNDQFVSEFDVGPIVYNKGWT